MADEATIKSFLVELGYKVDETSSDRFIDAIASATKRVLELGAAVEAAVVGVLAFTTKVADQLSKLYFESERTKTSIENIKAFTLAMSNIGISAEETNATLEKLGEFMRESPGAAPMLQQYFDEFANGAKVTEDVTEDLKNLAIVFANMSDASAQALGRSLHLSYNMTEALRTHGKEIQGFENLVHEAYRRVGFDAQDAGKKSVTFMDELRAVWSAGLEPIIDKIAVGLMPGLTKDMEQFRQLLLSHADEIEKVAKQVIDCILYAGDQLLKFGGEAAQWASDVIKAWDDLTPANKQLIIDLGLLLAAVLAFRSAPLLIGALALGELIKEFDALQKGTWEWKRSLEDLGGVALGAWALGLTKPLGMVLRFLRFVPNSGVTDAVLTALGIPIVDLAIASAAAAGANYVEGQHAASGMDLADKMGFQVSETDRESGFPTEYYNPKTHETHSAAWFDERYKALQQQAPPDNAEQQRTQQWLMEFLTSRGETNEQAAGVVGNARAESSFDPYASNAGHLGLFQWDATRQADFARIYGHSVDDRSVDRNQLIMEQAEFALHELQTTHKAAGDALVKAVTAGQSADVVGKDFEVYGDDPAEAAKRRAFAEAALAQYDALHRTDTDRHAAPQPAPQVHVHVAPAQPKVTTHSPANVTQHVTNHISTNDTNGMVNALDRVNARANADLIRRSRPVIV